MCVSVCVCVCTSQNWPKRRCRHGKKIACKSSNRLRSSLRRCRRRCCRLFCDSQLFNFPIFQWKYSGLKSKSSPNLCQQEWCFFNVLYVYIYISFILYILPWIRPWISLNNPELHNVICMEPRRIPGKNLLFGQKSKEFLEATKEKQKNIPGPFLKPVNVDCQRMGWFYVLSVFCQRIWIETKRSPQILSKSISHQSHQVTQVKYWGMYWDLVSNVTHLKFEKNWWRFLKTETPSPVILLFWHAVPWSWICNFRRPFLMRTPWKTGKNGCCSFLRLLTA